MLSVRDQIYELEEKQDVVEDPAKFKDQGIAEGDIVKVSGLASNPELNGYYWSDGNSVLTRCRVQWWQKLKGWWKQWDTD